MNKENQSEVFFNRVTSITLGAGGTGSVSCIPNTTLSTRLASAADLYALYRIRNFRFRLRGDTNSTPTECAMAYIPDVTDATPNAINQITEVKDYAYKSANDTKPSDWRSVPSSVLRGALDWYKTVTGTATDWEEQAGILFFVGSANRTLVYEVEGTYTFKDPVPAGLTPQMRLDKEKAKATHLLSALLKTTSPSSDGASPAGVGARK